MALRVAGAAEGREWMPQLGHRLQERQAIEIRAGLVGVATDDERMGESGRPGPVQQPSEHHP